MSSEQSPSYSDRLASVILSTAMLVAIVASIVVIWGGHSAMENLKLATGYASLIFLFFLSMVVLIDIIRNKINLSEMLEELSGGASMSRFQLLIFTFVIAFSFFVIVADQGKFPDIPTNVLALLGVSASTYAVSKGLQVSSGVGKEQNTTDGSGKTDAAESEDNRAS
jgi:hypothetical protein